MVKIVDGHLMTGEQSEVDLFIDCLNTNSSFGTVVHGPAIFKSYGMTILQAEDCSSTIHADEKRNKIESVPLSCVRHSQCDFQLNDTEKSSFMSFNSSIGWLGIAAFPHCAFYASHLQQRNRSQCSSPLCTNKLPASAAVLWNKHFLSCTWRQCLSTDVNSCVF